MLVDRIPRTVVTVATGVFAVGKTTCGMLSLAAALGGSVTGALTWSHSRIYILASRIGGASTAALFVHLPPPLQEADRPVLSQVEWPDSRIRRTVRLDGTAQMLESLRHGGPGGKADRGGRDERDMATTQLGVQRRN